MPAADHLYSLIETYHDLNSTTIDELPSLPSALECSRYVGKNRPFIVRHGAKDWAAVRKWDADYLCETMKGSSVKVAVTPSGNADAVVEDGHGRLTFVEPYEVDEKFEDFLLYVRADRSQTGTLARRNVKYAQTQNDNLREEYLHLFADVPADIPFASAALEMEPDAVNFWLGNERSTTALHKDNYENIYVQIRGLKHFTLLPPVEMPCVNETAVPRARYRPMQDESERLTISIDVEAEPLPVPIWDPDEPELRQSAFSKFSKASRVTLNEGDMMYLPAMWYHKVSQSSGEEDYACSVNYWYDMDFAGSFWANNAFVRDVYNATLKQVVYPQFDLSEVK